MPGVVNANGSLHVRGGLGDEVAYFIDGVPANDPYSGRLAVAVPPHLIEDIRLTTGNLPARYGNTMSGVVELATVQPGHRIGGGLKWTSDLLTGSRHDNQWEVSLSGPLPHAQDFIFGIAAQVHNGRDVRPCFMPDNKMYVHDPARDYFWGDTIRMDGALWDTLAHDFRGGWLDSSDAAWQTEKARRIQQYTRRGWQEWDKPYLPNGGFNDYFVSGSMAFPLPAGLGQMKITDMASRRQHGEYTATWKYNLDGYGASLERSNMLAASWQHTFDPLLGASVRIGWVTGKQQRGILDTLAGKDRSWWQDYRFISDDKVRAMMNWGNTSDNPFGFYENYLLELNGIGLPPGLGTARSSGVTGNLDFDGIRGSWRYAAGIELGLGNIDRRSTAFVDYHFMPNIFSDSFSVRLRTGVVYLQGAYTFRALTVAPGLRFNWGTLSGEAYSGNMWNIGYDRESVFDRGTITALSPTISVSCPVTPVTTMQASFERRNALPTPQRITDMMLEVERWNYPASFDPREDYRGAADVYNADLFFRYQWSDQYQVSIRQHLPLGISANATLYVTNFGSLPQPQMIIINSWGGPGSYNLYGLTLYGRSRGMELETRWDHEMVSMYLNYAFEKSVSGSDFSGSSQDYDLRHKMTQITKYTLSQSFGPKLGSFRPLADLTFGLVNNVASGFPYSRHNSHGRVIGGENGSRTPWTWTTDLAITREFAVRSVNCALGLEVTNLFDRKNLCSVFPFTGSATDNGTLLSIDQVYPTNDSISQFYSVSVDTSSGSGTGSYTYQVPNQFYSTWADLDGNGYINRNERYVSYVKAWHDIMDDPYNAERTPFDRAFLQPRLIKLSLGIRF